MKSVAIIIATGILLTISGIYAYSVYHQDQLVKECGRQSHERDTDADSEAACLALK